MTQSILEKAGGGKFWISAGFAGTVCAWLFMKEIPAMRDDAAAREAAAVVRETAAAIREEKRITDAREDRREGIKHASMGIETFSNTCKQFAVAIEKNADAINSLQTALREEQEKTRRNNDRLNELKLKKMSELTDLE